jgi:hypothetical protein
MHRPDESLRENNDLFANEYTLAWIQSGRPTSVEIDDVFSAALDGVLPARTELHILWNFMRGAIAQSVPISWFSTYRPGREKPTMPQSPLPPMSMSPVPGLIEKLMQDPNIHVRGFRISGGKITPYEPANAKQHSSDMEMNRPDDPVTAELWDAYLDAFMAAGYPNADTLEDTILSAIGTKDQEPPAGTAEILWQFVRANNTKMTPRWFLTVARGFGYVRSASAIVESNAASDGSDLFSSPVERDPNLAGFTEFTLDHMAAYLAADCPVVTVVEATLASVMNKDNEPSAASSKILWHCYREYQKVGLDLQPFIDDGIMHELATTLRNEPASVARLRKFFTKRIARFKAFESR